MKNGLLVTILILVTSECLFAQPLKLLELTEVKPLKRGKTYNITWSGGQADQVIEIKLYRHAEEVQSWDETLNDGVHEIKLNSKLKPGGGYVFKILAGGDVVNSQSTEIKRKIPLALTISAAIIVPAAVILFNKKDDGGKMIPPAPPPSVGN